MNFKEEVKTVFQELNSPQLSRAQALLTKLAVDKAIHGKNQIAYVLATVMWETDETFKPIPELGKGKGYKYGIPDPTTKQTYYGRGYEQLTWKEAYAKYSKLLGVDLVNNPDLLTTDLDLAYKSLVLSMTGQDPTGKKLDDYINDTKCDFFNARRIINPGEVTIKRLNIRANKIVALAERFLKVI